MQSSIIAEKSQKESPHILRSIPEVKTKVSVTIEEIEGAVRGIHKHVNAY